LLLIFYPFLVSCENIADIANGTTTTNTDGHTTSKTYQCYLGYSLRGRSEVTCQEDGSWSSNPPDCGTLNMNNTITAMMWQYYIE
jgi:hypothetical protein